MRTHFSRARRAWWMVALAVAVAGLLVGAARAEAVPVDPLEAQVRALIEAVRGKRIALLTDPTGVDSKLTPIYERLLAEPEVTLAAFFAHEHGIRGDQQAGEHVADLSDSRTGLPVYSLYGERKAPTAEQLAGIDALVFDCQDVGARFYVRVWTMTHAMEACAAQGVEFIVFDRPNPIGLSKCEGAPIRFDAGLVGRVWPGAPFGVPTRPGMSIGEIALLVNGEWLSPRANLRVIPIPGYTRAMSFAETGREWVITSPNMPSIDTAYVYPGMCLIEATNLSEGRGTTKPFEFVGAPFIDGVALADKLNQRGLAGVRFRAVWFTPTFSKFGGEQCSGVEVHVLDREAFDPILTGLTVLHVILKKYPDRVTVRDYASKLMGVENLPERLGNESPESIVSGWQEDLEAFKAMREKYLIYRGEEHSTR